MHLRSAAHERHHANLAQLDAFSFTPKEAGLCVASLMKRSEMRMTLKLISRNHHSHQTNPTLHSGCGLAGSGSLAQSPHASATTWPPRKCCGARGSSAPC